MIQQLGSEPDNDIQSNRTTAISINPLDPAALRLTQDFAAFGVKKALMTVPVRKPNKQEFIRVHPAEEFRLQTALLELKEERETYLVDPSLWGELAVEIVPKVIFVIINRQGVVSLWPIRLPDANGRLDDWNQSALDAANLAMSEWVRITANMSLGAYEVFTAPPGIPEPTWPEYSFTQLLNIAFRGRFIQDFEHPVLRRLRGH
jgi:hypothetical protein